MKQNISILKSLKENISTGVLIDNFNQLSLSLLNENESRFAEKKLEKESECTIFQYPEIIFFGKIKENDESYISIEQARTAGAKLYKVLKADKIDSVQILNLSERVNLLSFLEGLLLASYSFEKYKKVKNEFHLKNVFLFDHNISQAQVVELQNIVEAVFRARDLVNEPLSYLTATKFSEEIEKLGAEAGFEVEVFNKKKIEVLKMGGLLAVNKGSIDPPTFNILDWNPKEKKSEKTLVLVGKGVVFDTGGLSLKPTQKSMDYMKCDMAGAAVVASVLYAAAKNNVPFRVIGLIPATDNRPDGNAYVPGDVITMFDGTTVEIKNTDAEGRLILADALSYAKKYSPELVIDIATLTGSAEIIAANRAIVAMGNNKEYLKSLEKSGRNTFERIIEVPLWDEFAKPLKSSIADLNNLGTREGQTSIAGKFLEHFTDYRWIHLDAAGVSFSFEEENYRPVGGTGYGTRLIYDFLKKFN